MNEINDTAFFDVPGIRCEGCASTIRETLLGIEGVRTIDVDVQDKTVEVGFDASITRETALRGALAAAGFSPTP